MQFTLTIELPEGSDYLSLLCLLESSQKLIRQQGVMAGGLRKPITANGGGTPDVGKWEVRGATHPDPSDEHGAIL